MSLVSHSLCARFSYLSYNEATGKVGEIEYYVQELEDCQIVAIRGTEANGSALWKEGGWRDVLMDLRIGVRFWHGLRGHAGMLRGALALCQQLKGELDYSKPVVLTGHSLGGALALVSGWVLKLFGHNIRQITTFGSPKVLSKGHILYRSIEVTEYMYGNDAVCQLPFFKLLREHLNLVHIGPARRGYFKRSLADHSITNYIGEL